VLVFFILAAISDRNFSIFASLRQNDFHLGKDHPEKKLRKETTMSIIQQAKDYQPTKTTLFWSAAGAAVLTMVVGFAWGGWVTGGTATQMAQDAAQQSTAKLAAVICVERFINAHDAPAQLAALKETSRWQRKRFVEDGNWTTLTGFEQPVSGAADLCAEQLADMELPELPVADTVDATIESESSVQ
jgi:hypothetical protein